MRLLPKMKLTSKVKRLLKLHSEKPGSLGRFQQKLVHDFINGGNRLVSSWFDSSEFPKPSPLLDFKIACTGNIMTFAI